MTSTELQDRFHDRVAVVTGAAAGIGRAVAQRLAYDGATVVVVDNNADGAREVAVELEEHGGRAHARPDDVSDPAVRRTLIPEVVETFGRIDILVNNAATLGSRSRLVDLDEDDWARVVDTNLTAVAFLSRDAARAMLRSRAGVIINVTSLQERLPLPAHIAYVASKGGVSALTRALAIELAHTGVRVNAVAPGMIGSPGLADELAEADAQDTVPAPNLVGRLGAPAEVASIVAYLASDEAGYVTGALWDIDGGRQLSRQPDPLMPDGKD